MGVRLFAVISGIIYLVVGILGFFPVFLTAPIGAPDLAVDGIYGYLFGIFPVNSLHNIVHLAVGIWGILAYRRYSSARTYSKSLAIFYGVLAIMGLFPILKTTFGLIPIFGNDIWLHALTALIAAYYGFIARRPATVLDAEAEREPVSSRDIY